MTRRDLAEKLESMGIEGPALEALLRETAPNRHRERVEAARRAAEEYYLDAAEIDRDECGPDGLAAFAAATLWADVIGVGGPEGVRGDATDRHPALAACGKGRKQASDGGAWSAAIREAAECAPGAFEAVNGGLAFRTDHAHVGVVSEYIPERWMLSIAREGLRRAVGLVPWHPEVPFEAGDPVIWAEIVNGLMAAANAAEEPPVEAVEEAVA